MATNFSPCEGSYVLNQFPSNVMFGMNGFHVSASGAIQGHHGPLVFSLSSANAFNLDQFKFLSFGRGLTLKVPITTEVAFAASLDQDKAVQNMQPNLGSTVSALVKLCRQKQQ